MRVRSPRSRRGRPHRRGAAARLGGPRDDAHASGSAAARLARCDSSSQRIPPETGGVMKKRSAQLRALVALAGIVAIAVAASSSVGSAGAHRSSPVPPDAVVTWNAYAVNAVRASTPTKFQTDGMLYMAYVQAAVYDAVTKLDGRYQPYHDFAFTPAAGASVQAAVAAAARTTLDSYLPDQVTTVDAEYNAYLGSLSGGVADGVAAGEAAANDLISLRTGDGLRAATPVYGGIGPLIPGKWQLQSPTQSAQTPW